MHLSSSLDPRRTELPAKEASGWETFGRDEASPDGSLSYPCRVLMLRRNLFRAPSCGAFVSSRSAPAKNLVETLIDSDLRGSQAYMIPEGCGFTQKLALPALDILGSFPLRPWLLAEVEISP